MDKMKTQKLFIIISLIVTGFLLIGVLVLTLTPILEKWTLFWITFGILCAFWLITGLIILIKKFNTVDTVSKAMSVKDAIAKEIKEIVEDDQNPDNLKLLKVKKMNMGIDGMEKTPVLLLVFHGKELNEIRISIINLKDAKNPSRLIDPLLDEIAETMRYTAEMPSPDPIKETIKPFFQNGLPLNITERIIPPSPSTKKEEEEKIKLGEKSEL